ncbi:hypothetical protein ASE04_29685 [Rhizobium sp. Root708]|nr:hypothetical protein ASE04_29685 [Rhizobium sp. Root708]
MNMARMSEAQTARLSAGRPDLLETGVASAGYSNQSSTLPFESRRAREDAIAKPLISKHLR